MLARFGRRPTPPLSWSAYALKADIAAASAQVSFAPVVDVTRLHRQSLAGFL
jgi:hypothetical protein